MAASKQTRSSAMLSFAKTWALFWLVTTLVHASEGWYNGGKSQRQRVRFRSTVQKIIIPNDRAERDGRRKRHGIDHRHRRVISSDEDEDYSRDYSTKSRPIRIPGDQAYRRAERWRREEAEVEIVWARTPTPPRYRGRARLEQRRVYRMPSSSSTSEWGSERGESSEIGPTLQFKFSSEWDKNELKPKGRGAHHRKNKHCRRK